MTLAAVPMPDTPEAFTDDDFDHLEEAKAALEDVVVTGRIDFTAAVEVAKTHALISIAQSLETLAFASVLDGPEGPEYALSIVNIDEFNSVAEEPPLVGITGSTIDYYREG